MMLKFVHAADIHLDSSLRGISDHNTWTEELYNATTRAFQALVDQCLKERVDFVVFTGNFYDGDWKDFNTALFLNQQMARLDEENIPVYMVTGHHDAANTITTALTLPKNVTRFSHLHAETHKLEQLKVALHGQSYHPTASAGELAKDYPKAVKGYFNIGVLHSRLGPGAEHDSDAPSVLGDLESKGYDYWALGYGHKREIVKEHDPCVVIPGCLQGRHIKETGPKGATLVTVTENATISLQCLYVDVVRWCHCKVDLSTAKTKEEALKTLETQIIGLQEAAAHRPVVIRVHLHGTTPLAYDLLISPEHWQSDIRRCLEDIAIHLDFPLWIEKIVNNTQPPSRRTTATTKDEEFHDLITALNDPQYNVSTIPGLQDIINQLKNKIPQNLLHQKTSDDDTDKTMLCLNDPHTIATLVNEGKQLLYGMILHKEDS